MAKSLPNIISNLKMFFAVKLVASEVSSSAGRSQERFRRVALTAITSAFSRAINQIIMLITVPLTFNYLGPERFGTWVTISSMIALLNFTDLGIGNGLLNAISEANSKNDIKIAKHYTSNAFILLILIALLICSLFMVIYPFISWIRIFNIASSQGAAEVGPAMAVFIVCFALSLPFSIAQKIHSGYQQGFINNLWSTFGNLLSLIGLQLVVYYKLGLPWLVFTMVGGPAVISLCNFVVLLRWQRPELFIRHSYINLSITKTLLNSGIQFFAIQLSGAIGYQTDNIVISQILGPNLVTQYAIPMRMFSFIPSILGMLLMPLWPAYTEAYKREDYDWVVKTFQRTLFFSIFIVSIPNGILVVFGNLILSKWISPGFSTSQLLLGGLGIWALLQSIQYPISMFLNGLGIIKFQVILTPIWALVNLFLSILLVTKMGVAGAILGTSISVVLIVLLPYAWYTYRTIRHLQTRKKAKEL